jgi:hypothetical protein
MNIQNIASLGEQMHSLGFENKSFSLLKRICFKPESFIISQKVEKEKEQLIFSLFFEKGNKQNVYALIYYDAILLKEMDSTGVIINGINIYDLEKRMTEIDWKNAFALDLNKEWSVEDKSTWEKEFMIKSIVEDLIALEVSEEGKTIAVSLKLKYWNSVPYKELFGNINPLKNKFEISQRFYFSQEQAGISVDEAYRFLQNRWLEKQVQVKKKQNGSPIGESKIDSYASGNSILKKKRSSKSKGVKTRRAGQN